MYSISVWINDRIWFDAPQAEKKRSALSSLLAIYIHHIVSSRSQSRYMIESQLMVV